jgi:hypothetical protein
LSFWFDGQIYLKMKRIPPGSPGATPVCEAYRLYCKKDEVIDQLGSDFYVDEADEGERATKGKRKRS